MMRRNGRINNSLTAVGRTATAHVTGRGVYETRGMRSNNGLTSSFTFITPALKIYSGLPVAGVCGIWIKLAVCCWSEPASSIDSSLGRAKSSTMLMRDAVWWRAWLPSGRRTGSPLAVKL